MFHQAWAIDKQECKMIKTDSLITHIPEKRLVAHISHISISFPCRSQLPLSVPILLTAELRND